MKIYCGRCACSVVERVLDLCSECADLDDEMTRRIEWPSSPQP